MIRRGVKQGACKAAPFAVISPVSCQRLTHVEAVFRRTRRARVALAGSRKVHQVQVAQGRLEPARSDGIGKTGRELDYPEFTGHGHDTPRHRGTGQNVRLLRVSVPDTRPLCDVSSVDASEFRD